MMQYSTFTKVALLIAAHGISSAYSEGYSTVCTSILYNTEGWLIGTCPTTDSTGEITSSVSLASKLKNDNGKLAWADKGEYTQSCIDCSLLSGGSTLQCSCTGAYSGQRTTSTLNLEEYIANYNGHLLSNLTGAITSIPANSSYAVPSDFILTNLFSGLNSTCTSTSSYSFAAPNNCYSLNLGVQSSWGSVKQTTNQGWGFVGYDNAQCTGDAVVKVTPSDLNTCVNFDKSVYGFSLTPLWNYN